MQDVQNIPNPDVNSTETDEDFGSHSGIEQVPDSDDIENPEAGERIGSDVEREDETIPVSPDTEPQQAPIEEPPDVNSPPIEED
jgi:hypothetical protein